MNVQERKQALLSSFTLEDMQNPVTRESYVESLDNIIKEQIW